MAGCRIYSFLVARPREGQRKAPFPWLLLLLLIATVVLFWVLPYQMGPAPVEVDWEPSPANPS